MDANSSSLIYIRRPSCFQKKLSQPGIMHLHDELASKLYAVVTNGNDVLWCHTPIGLRSAASSRDTILALPKKILNTIMVKKT